MIKPIASVNEWKRTISQTGTSLKFMKTTYWLREIRLYVFRFPTSIPRYYDFLESVAQFDNNPKIEAMLEYLLERV